MNADSFLGRLEGVRPRGTGKWSARCPAHGDSNPSLAIREGERGLLLKCWAGCTVNEICEVLGIEISDLFYDSRKSTQHPRRQVRPRFNLNQIGFQFRLHAAVLAIRAEETLKAARGLDCSAWQEDDLHFALEAVGRAYNDIARADLLDDTAFALRCRSLESERSDARAA